jgi:hypothetical protein
MVDENDRPADAVAYQDIVRVVVVAENELQVRIWVAGTLPTHWDEVREQILAGYLVDTTGDGSPDYQVNVQNGADDRWIASFLDLATGTSKEGFDFPGLAVPYGDLIDLRLALRLIGDPSGPIRVSVYTEHDLYPNPVGHPFDHTLRRDRTPNHTYPVGPDWIVVRPPVSAG